MTPARTRRRKRVVRNSPPPPGFPTPALPNNIHIDNYTINIADVSSSSNNVDPASPFIPSSTVAPRPDNHKTAVNIDEDDPSMKDIAEDIYKKLHTEELEKRPLTGYIDKVQRHVISVVDRACCVEHLIYMVYCLGLHLAVNYLNRCLSEAQITSKSNRGCQRNLDMVGITCLVLACKYEEIRRSKFDFKGFIDRSGGTFSRYDIIRTEGLILKFLNYDVADPTCRSFLDRYLRAAYLGGIIRVRIESLESMANYLSELSLLSYGMTIYLLSMVAASSVFLALCILIPWEGPWNAILQLYTLYQPSDLQDCATDLHRFCYWKNGSDDMRTIAVKYSQNKYDNVSFRTIPEIIIPIYFANFF